ncbi:GNAT family N-acetyltransferase [Aquibacillus halophilus]
MTKTVHIRRTTNTDLPQLYELMREYIVHFYKQKQPDEQDLKTLIKNLIDDPKLGLQFVAVNQAGGLLGFATLYFTFSTLKVKQQAILNDLFVTADARGNQLGERLFQTCLSYVRDNDFCSMTWETGKDNEVAQKLYEKMGGEISDWLFYEIK